MRLNLHGCVAVESATQIVEEEYEEPVKVVKGEGAQIADAPMQVQSNSLLQANNCSIGMVGSGCKGLWLP